MSFVTSFINRFPPLAKRRKAMNKKEILHQCEMLYSVFDDLNNPRSGCEVRDYCEIQAFAFGLLNEHRRIRSFFGKDLKDYEGKIAEDLLPLELEIFQTGFGLGYAIGRLFDTPYPKTENAVKSIQALLKEKALLPYFPRENERRKS
jgi:hypothetical protein